MPTQMSSQLVWQFIRKHTSFIKVGLHGEKFTTEPGNLTAKHSYKYSGACWVRVDTGLCGDTHPHPLHHDRAHMHTGLANEKTIDLAAGSGSELVLTKKTKAAKKPAGAVKKVSLKKRHPRQLKAVGAEAQTIRPDLKVC